MRTRVWIVVGVGLVLLLSGCSQKKLQVNDAWARPGVTGGNSAIYFALYNDTKAEEALVGAAAEIAEVVEIHRSLMVDGVMKMEPQDSVPLPPRATVDFAPGGLHVMLINLQQDLKPGDKFTASLSLGNGTEISVPVVVKEP